MIDFKNSIYFESPAFSSSTSRFFVKTPAKMEKISRFLVSRGWHPLNQGCHGNRNSHGDSHGIFLPMTILVRTV